MAYSSILGTDLAPEEPGGREAELLGPSDNSDTGSDTVGSSEAHEESTDAFGTGERGAVAGGDTEPGKDILPDRVVNLANDEGFPEADPDGMEMTDIDTDKIAPDADPGTSGEQR